MATSSEQGAGLRAFRFSDTAERRAIGTTAQVHALLARGLVATQTAADDRRLQAWSRLAITDAGRVVLAALAGAA